MNAISDRVQHIPGRLGTAPLRSLFGGSVVPLRRIYGESDIRAFSVEVMHVPCRHIVRLSSMLTPEGLPDCTTCAARRKFRAIADGAVIASQVSARIQRVARQAAADEGVDFDRLSEENRHRWLGIARRECVEAAIDLADDAGEHGHSDWSDSYSAAASIGLLGMHTLEEIGHLIGVSRERVRQIEVQAMKKLERRMLARGFTCAADLASSEDVDWFGGGWGGDE